MGYLLNASSLSHSLAYTLAYSLVVWMQGDCEQECRQGILLHSIYMYALHVQHYASQLRCVAVCIDALHLTIMYNTCTG